MFHWIIEYIKNWFRLHEEDEELIDCFLHPDL